MVNWCWFWTLKTRFHISQHFFSQESQEWNTCTQMPKIDYLNSRPTTINLSKPCLMCFSCFSDGSRYKSLVARMNPKTRITWSVSAAAVGCLLRHGIGGGATHWFRCWADLMSWYAVSEIGAFSPLRLNHLNPNPGDSKGFSASAWSMQRLVPEKRSDFHPPFLVRV